MALDEAILTAMPRLGKPLLRFYSWTEAAATFGYFQKYAVVAPMTRLRPLIRRPTGGGLVPHDADWTYSLFFPAGDDWYELRAIESYRRVHEWLREAFGRLGVKTELSRRRHNESSGQCFAGAERFDLVAAQKKIAGAAQRRARSGLLVQGSVQPPAGVAKADWQKALCDVAHRRWSVEWLPLEIESALVEGAGHLAREKYSQESYNEQR